MRRSFIGRIAAVLGVATAMGASGLSKKEVVEAHHQEQYNESRGSIYGNEGGVQYFNHRGQAPRKFKGNKMAMDGYLNLRRNRHIGHLDASTVFPNFGEHDNSDDARRKRRADNAIMLKERHERRKRGVKYLTI